MKHAVVIGSGFAGLSVACFLAAGGLRVTVLEKNATPGGRARSFSAEGFSFDMGPSWYWMPDVIEGFFNKLGKSTSDYYELQRLDPSYQVIWQDETLPIPANFRELQAVFERIETGAGKQLEAFMQEAAYKYDTAMRRFIYKPGLSVGEFANWETMRSLLRIDLLGSIHSHVRKYFSHPKLLQLVEFPILFLGALPQNTPALYSLMNYADMKLGTWYPTGGMVQLVHAMYSLASELGVTFHFEADVKNILVRDGRATGVVTDKAHYAADIVVAACDYQHFDQHITPEPYRNYTPKYWNSRSMAPSCLLYYMGINAKVNDLQHHNIFFDAPFEKHAQALYTHLAWPEDPLMYMCAPSKTDSSVAPPGCENIFALIPTAPGLEDTAEIREHYYSKVLQKLEAHSGQLLRNKIVFSKSYAHTDFVHDYNAFKGNAYGLANTLRQTAFMKPAIRNKKLSNVFYTGQLTVPGPGVPPALISGEIVAGQICKQYATTKSLAL